MNGMSGKVLEAATAPKTAGQIRLPFFYGWLLVGVSFVTMAIAVNARTGLAALAPTAKGNPTPIVPKGPESSRSPETKVGIG